MAQQKATYGVPCAGSTSDVWSMSSCRESFGCLRISMVLDGGLVEKVTGHSEYVGKLVDMCPIIAFDKFEESRHTGAALARWKKAALLKWMMLEAIELATEDGASNNKKANAILGMSMIVCYPHNVARAVLIASGMGSTPSKNVPLKMLGEREGKQSAAFSRSVVTNKALQQAQLDADPDLKPHATLAVKSKNATRWLGLWEMCHRNRLLGPEIRIALTGEQDGTCLEEEARPAARVQPTGSDTEDDDGGSSGDDLEEGNRVAGKQFTLAHRCLSSTDFRHNDIYESLLDRAREVTLLVQDKQREGYGEGMDLGVSYLLIEAVRDEAAADRVMLVSGRKEKETWKEVSAGSLPAMFGTFREILVKELTERFELNTTPNKHVLLALKMNPSVNTKPDSPQLNGKVAKGELMQAEYKRALRRQAIFLKQRLASTAAAPTAAPIAAPTAVPTAAPTAAPTATDADATTTATPPLKKRKNLLGAVMDSQSVPMEATGGNSAIDNAVQSEVDNFDMISMKILAEGSANEYYKGELFNLHAFWADHKSSLPLHYGVYLAEVGCKKAAAANVESVFSGAGKFTEEAKSTGAILLQRMIRLHYNWKYAFLRPTNDQVCKRYMEKFHPVAPDDAALADPPNPAGPSDAVPAVAAAPAAPAAIAPAAAVL